MSEEGSVKSWQSGVPGPSCLANEETSDISTPKGSSCSQTKSIENDEDFMSCSDLMSVSEGDGVDIETTNNDCISARDPTHSIIDDEDTSVCNSERPFDGELVVDRLLQRILTERMFELRRIRHGDRPVTGSRSRETLDNFFSRALNPNTRSDVEMHRPASVRDEVRLLSSSGVVSSVLGSASLRQTMERTLVGRAARPIGNDTRASRTNESGRNLARLIRTVETSRVNPAIDAAGNSRPNVNRSDESSREISPDEARLNAMLDAGMQLLSESVNTDIDSLQGLRIVTSVLGGAFRHDLEQLVQARVAQSGGGQQVADFISSLPRTVVRQQAPQTQTGSSPLPHRSNLPTYGQVAADLRQLQSEVSDMKHMLSLSFELQMDTQRAVRQEVAAVFSAFMDQYVKQSGDMSAPSSAQQPRRTQPVSGGSCAVCLEKSVDTILYKCGHLCVCHPCGLQLKMKGHHCPICRAPILDVVRAYQTQ